MIELTPGVAIVLAGLLLALFGVGARLSPSSIALGSGPFQAVLTGAAFLLFLGGGVEWRRGELAAVESGVQIASRLEESWIWWLVIPVLVLGVAILSISVRQLLRGRVQGAAGWVGLVLVLGVVGLEESSGRIWVTPGTHRLHARVGVLLPRESEMAASEVGEVRVATARVRGAPLTTVRLAGPDLPDSFTAFGYDSRDDHVARVEVDRWASVGGWAVREAEPLAEE